MKEIESKAWVYQKDKKRVLDFLNNETKSINLGKIKKDTMYSIQSDNDLDKKTEFRLREEKLDTGGVVGREDVVYTVTRKTRSYTDSGTEVNEELEFFVDSSDKFHEFVSQLGYEVMYTKEKKVKQFTLQGAKYTILFEYVEMSELSKIGDLLEIEIVCDDNVSEIEVSSVEDYILSFFKTLNINTQIESLPYGKLLGMF